MSGRRPLTAVTEFSLEGPSDNESNLFLDESEPIKHPKKTKTMNHKDLKVWYLRAIFITLCVIALCIIGFAVAIVILIPVTVTSSGVKRATILMDKVMEMHDYTKTMTDVTTGSKSQIEALVETYKVNDMIQGLQDMVAHSRSLLQNLKPSTVDAASESAKKLVDALSTMDMARGKELLNHVTDLLGAVQPQQLNKAVEQGAIFLQKGNEALTQASQTNLVQYVSQVAASTIDFESRLMRTNEITIKLPQK